MLLNDAKTLEEFMKEFDWKLDYKIPEQIEERLSWYDPTKNPLIFKKRSNQYTFEGILVITEDNAVYSVGCCIYDYNSFKIMENMFFKDLSFFWFKRKTRMIIHSESEMYLSGLGDEENLKKIEKYRIRQ